MAYLSTPLVQLAALPLVIAHYARLLVDLRKTCRPKRESEPRARNRSKRN